jgi:hypothetical protein
MPTYALAQVVRPAEDDQGEGAVFQGGFYLAVVLTGAVLP